MVNFPDNTIPVSGSQATVMLRHNSNSPLPVKLIYFRAAIDGNKVVTNWKTAQEKDNHFFTVQKTTDTLETGDLFFAGGEESATDKKDRSSLGRPVMGRHVKSGKNDMCKCVSSSK